MPGCLSAPLQTETEESGSRRTSSLSPVVSFFCCLRCTECPRRSSKERKFLPERGTKRISFASGTRTLQSRLLPGSSGHAIWVLVCGCVCLFPERIKMSIASPLGPKRALVSALRIKGQGGVRWRKKGGSQAVEDLSGRSSTPKAGALLALTTWGSIFPKSRRAGGYWRVYQLAPGLWF